MKERIIESIIAFIFGLVITVTAACTNAGVAIIVLGAILMAIGVGCFIWALVDKKKATDKVAEDAKIELERKAELSAKEAELADARAEIAALNSKLDELEKAKKVKPAEEKKAEDKKPEKKPANKKASK